MQNAAEDNQRELFARRADQAADRKQHQGRAKSDPLPDQCDHKSVQPLACHRNDEGSCHELRLILSDPKGTHDIRNGDVHHRAGQDHRESRDHAGAGDKNPIARAEAGVKVVNRFRCARHGLDLRRPCLT